MREETKTTTIKLCKLVGITVAVYIAMRYILTLVVPFLLAFLVASLLHPLVQRMERSMRQVTKKKHNLLCTVVVLGFWILTAALAAAFLFMALREGEQAVNWVKNWVEDRGGIQCTMRYCWDCGLDKLGQITGYDMEQLRQEYDSYQGKLLLFLKEKVMPGCSKGLMLVGRKIVGMVAVLFVVIVSSMIFLSGYERDSSWLKSTYFGRSAARILSNVKEAGGAYVKAQILIMFVVSTVCVAGLALLKSPYAFLGGIGIGICDALPFLGTGTILVPLALLELIQQDYGLAAGYFLLYMACSFLRNLMEPRLIGGKLGVHPIAVMMSIYVGILIYGAGGVLLGPASALVIREIYRKMT